MNITSVPLSPRTPSKLSDVPVRGFSSSKRGASEPRETMFEGVAAIVMLHRNDDGPPRPNVFATRRVHLRALQSICTNHRYSIVAVYWSQSTRPNRRWRD